MKKILIVDDMKVSLMMTENMLSGEYKTFCASSGPEAIEIYHQERPDMVLSDLQMPGMSGYELQKKLQSEYQEQIPFMFMTADQDEEAESKGFDNGAMDFIRKPFRPDVLLRRVANILQTVEQIEGWKRHASTDSLTGLLNKTSAETDLKEVCRQATGALMMIDLDNFKLVNDIYGHSMGDKILISFADIIRTAMRPSDLVGRLGGDEFIAFCQGMCDEAGIANKSEYINRCLLQSAKDLMGEDMMIPLGASMGCVFVPAHGTHFSELYKKVDKMLYSVKQNGKHGYRIYDEHQALSPEQLASLTHIEMILGERNQLPGAMALPLDGFQAVYRFLRRTVGIYNIPACILVFSLNPEDDETFPLLEAEDQFYQVLQTTLRKGDAVTRNGSNQFVVLLSNTGYPELGHAVERIRRNWENTPAGEALSFSYEWADLMP